MRIQRLHTLILPIVAIFFISIVSANAATWTVTKSTDSNDNVCDVDCSLREAVFNADSGDTVDFNANLIGQTFTLGGTEIVITNRITIDGNLDGVNVAFISGSNTSRIFRIAAGGGLALRNAILVQGVGGPGSGNPNVNVGGAIYSEVSTSLSLDRVAIRGNTAELGGGVYLSTGTHHITNSSFTGNSAESGTAINEIDGATLFMSNTTISGNFLSNDMGEFGGGALVNRGSVATIRNCTIVNNSAKTGGGIAMVPAFNPTVVNIGNSIVAGNTATGNGPDIRYFPVPDAVTLTSVGGNLVQDAANLPETTFMQPNDLTGVNPLLGPTNAGQGGHPIATHTLQAGSPARNAGRNQNAVDPLTNEPLTTEARGAGFPRITDGIVDMGAFEDQSGNTSLVVTKNANSNDLVCDTDCSLREAVHQAGLNFGTETITFAANVFGTLALGGSEILIQNQNVNIVGYPDLNAETLIASGNDVNRVLRLNNATVNISGMTFANGNAGAGFGGAILAENNSNLTLDKVIVRNNFAAAYGAAHLSGGTHRIINSTINNNSANTGLALSTSGTLNMANTTVSGNFDADGGTGIGAIFVTGTANIRNSTIAFNRTSGGTGGGIFNSGTLNMGNTIVSNNIAANSPDIHQSSGSLTSVGGNLVQSTVGFPGGTFSQTNDTTGVDPMLATLADNGGAVTTQLLQPLSPAINSGVNANAIDPFDISVLQFDARGNVDRIINGTVDKGSFESLIPTAASVTVSGRVTTADGSGITRAFVVLTDSNGTTRRVMTGSFGYFRFAEVEAGETYVASVESKSFSFAHQIVVITEDLSELNFIAEEQATPSRIRSAAARSAAIPIWPPTAEGSDTDGQTGQYSRLIHRLR